jgi:mono/diheme cytochrome c family protein
VRGVPRRNGTRPKGSKDVNAQFLVTGTVMRAYGHRVISQALKQMALAAAVSSAVAYGAEAKVDTQFNVNQLFANTCGWCHADGGRMEGKGPQLMGTALTDDEIKNRIKNGKPGRMPGFGTTFTDEQLNAIVAYIRNLKPSR